MRHWTITICHFAAAVLVAGLAADASAATPVPAGAVPLTTAMIRQIYSDKTETAQNIRHFKEDEPRSETNTYYRKNGSLIGYFDDLLLPTHAYYWEGTWKVDGNELCTDRTTHQYPPLSEKLVDCTQFFKVGSQIWIVVSKHTSNGQPQADASQPIKINETDLYAPRTKVTDKINRTVTQLVAGNTVQQHFDDVKKQIATGFKD